jgi:hypothetical protein
MNRKAFHRAPWADFKLGFFSAFVSRPELISLPVSYDFQFWQKYEIKCRFPIGIHLTFLLKIEAS